MKYLFSLSAALLLSLPAYGGKLPADNQFFKEEAVVKTYNIGGANVRLLSTDKDFDTLNLELKELLGDGWVIEEPKGIKNPKIRKRAEENGLTPNTSVIYVTPDNPKFRVSLALTKMPGKAPDETVAILTIARNFKGK